jgi:SAM-dependent methyltransferase
VLLRTARLLTAFARADDKLDWVADKAAWRAFRARLPTEHQANRAFDRRYGTDTAEEVPLVATGISHEQARCGNGVYRPLWEGAFHDALRCVGVLPDGYSFIDLGCGKGKLLMLAAGYPFARIVGVEFAPTLVETAQRNLTLFRAAHPDSPPIEAVAGDARHWPLPAGPAMVMIFNSFDPATTRQVMSAVDREALRDQPLFVLYVNLRRVAEAGNGFADLSRLQCVRTTRRLLVFANAAARAARTSRRGPFP